MKMRIQNNYENTSLKGNVKTEKKRKKQINTGLEIWKK